VKCLLLVQEWRCSLPGAFGGGSGLVEFDATVKRCDVTGEEKLRRRREGIERRRAN
jgi:hypothetical protein